MNADEIRALVNRYHEAWGKGDVEGVLATLHEDYEYVYPAREKGHKTEGEACRIWHASFSETDLRVEQTVVEGDRVAVYWTLRARHAAEFMGIPASEKMVAFSGLEMHRVQDGKIIETRRITDTFELMQQLGAV